ncbi:hypothetical protein [Alloactinosynnema sp. L-07]|uniref:hypothetical protein n=1 Tax=Alloactinosynnema sp. L-07 TaxID=1653480 RepID=UPI0012F8C810|nr:hypothetical protein [Alloactinosynnema sp. L-07]
MADPTTNLVFTAAEDVRRVTRLICVLYPVFALALYLLIEWEDDKPWAIKFVVASVAYALAGALYLLVVPRRPTREFLARNGWRPASARLIGSTLEVDDPQVRHLRLTFVPRAHRLVIARTGRVWLVGPDAGGRVAVRVEGSHAVHPVRRADGTGASRTERLGDGATVTRLTARRLASTPVLTVSAMGLGYAAVSVNFTAPLFGTLVSCAVMTLFWSVAVIYQWQWCRLPALINAGEWVRAEIQLAPWTAQRNQIASAHGHIRLADGTILAISMRAAKVDLLGTILESGVLWVAGEPQPGRTVAVGFPGYPQLAVAKIAAYG